MNHRNQSCEGPEGIDLATVTFDIQSPGVLLATNSEADKIIVFQAAGKGDAFACRHRHTFEMPGGMKIKKIVPANGQLYIQMRDSLVVSISQYEPRNILKSLMSSRFLEEENLYELMQDPIDDLEVLGESIVLQSVNAQRLIIVNALAQRDEATDPSGKPIDPASQKSSLFSSENLTYLMFPVSIGVVYYYQVYIKANPLLVGNKDQQHSEAQRRGAVGERAGQDGRKPSRTQQFQSQERDRRAGQGRGGGNQESQGGRSQTRHGSS